MATTNFDKLTQGMRALQECLGPFIHQHLTKSMGGKWWTDGVLLSVSDMTRNELPASGNEKDLVNKLDFAALITVVQRHWGDIFYSKMGDNDRTYIFELFNMRRIWAHHGIEDTLGVSRK